MKKNLKIVDGDDIVLEKYLEYLYVTGQLDNPNEQDSEENIVDENDDTIAVKVKQRNNDE